MMSFDNNFPTVIYGEHASFDTYSSLCLIFSVLAWPMAITFLMFVSPMCVHLFSIILEVLPTYNCILPLPFQVVNKWFALQAMSDIPGNVENVRKLLSHPAFDLRNPNKVYSLIGGFCGSPVNFHAKDGLGYKFLGEIVLQLDKLNPQVILH